MRTELLKVRAQGYAIVDQEMEEGLRSVGTPIRDGGGRVVAAANISAHASRHSIESIRRELLPPLLAATARISADLRIAVPAGRVWPGPLEGTGQSPDNTGG